MAGKKISLIVMWSGWVFGLIATVIAVLAFIDNANNQSRSDLKEVIDLVYETSALLGAKGSDLNTFSTWDVRGKEYDESIDSHKVGKNIKKLEAMGQQDEVVALKLLYISKLRDHKIIKEYLDELGDELNDSQKNFYLGVVLSKDIDQIDLALSYMGKAVSLDPKNVGIRVIYALNLHSAKRDDQSIYQFKIALNQESTNIKIINKLGHVLVESGKYQEAQQLLFNSVDNGSADTGTYNVLGYLYTILKDFSSAKKYFGYSIDKDFLNPIPHRNLSLILKELGEIDEAKNEARLASKYGWAVPEGADYRSVVD